MARLARVEVFAHDEIAVVHVMARTVRRCFLFGQDELTGKCYDYRKDWIENELNRNAAGFGVDLLCFSILSNHFHLVLRSRPDVVATRDDTEVARRWLLLTGKDRKGKPPKDSELNRIRKDPEKLEETRERLSDISWWMRLMCQRVAQRANRDDEEVGKFFQARYDSVRLLDEASIVSCAAYVELNPIRAALAETLEDSEYTSAQRRIQSLCLGSDEISDIAVADSELEAQSESKPSTTEHDAKPIRPDRYLAPLTIDELRGAVGPCPSGSPYRASDKGFLNMSTEDYLMLLDWTARIVKEGKAGTTPSDLPPIIERLGLSMDIWFGLVTGFRKLFSSAAGKPDVVDQARSLHHGNSYYLPDAARELFASSP